MYDMKKLNNLKHLDTGAPDAMKAFWALEKATFKEGVLSEQTKQLIAVAVALVTQCPYCVEIHTNLARKAGATDAQLSETAVVAAVMRAGGSITHAAHLFEG